MSVQGIPYALVLILLLAGCSIPPPSRQTHLLPVFSGASAATTSRALALAAHRPCTDSFIAHTLDHTTTVRGETIRLFDSNGAGTAIGDLDDDGLLDLAFADLDGPNAIFWNTGELEFHKQILDDTNARAVNIIDADGDDRLDLVFTHRAAGISFWRNLGNGELVREGLPGVNEPAHSLAWGDLAGDTALDLVTGAYHAELDRTLGSGFLFNAGAGVTLYERRGATFVATRLSRDSHALTVALPDLNNDGRQDIWVGNDFQMRDQIWLADGGAWTPAEPFPATTENTMSIDQGDIDNDGRPELFAADMKPYNSAVETLVAWLPLMQTMPRRHDPSDPQVIENVLLVDMANGSFENQAYLRAVDATGWSWSSKFGDLDNDGFLDLYVVNGMIAQELFDHLPGDELIEANQALRNDGEGHFRPMPGWNLGSTFSGRGMSMADLDNDGDLDIVVNNLRGPAQLFENRLCGGNGLAVNLRWPASGNTRAIGARLALHTTMGTLYRDVRAGSGYLSGDPPRVHFGIPAGATPEYLEIRWPDGAVSLVRTPQAQLLLQITR